jgi:hypothetical protein
MSYFSYSFIANFADDVQPYFGSSYGSTFFQIKDNLGLLAS